MAFFDDLATIQRSGVTPVRPTRRKKKPAVPAGWLGVGRPGASLSPQSDWLMPEESALSQPVLEPFGSTSAAGAANRAGEVAAKRQLFPSTHEMASGGRRVMPGGGGITDADPESARAVKFAEHMDWLRDRRTAGLRPIAERRADVISRAGERRDFRHARMAGISPEQLYRQRIQKSFLGEPGPQGQAPDFTKLAMSGLLDPESLAAVGQQQAATGEVAGRERVADITSMAGLEASRGRDKTLFDVEAERGKSATEIARLDREAEGLRQSGQTDKAMKMEKMASDERIREAELDRELQVKEAELDREVQVRGIESGEESASAELYGARLNEWDIRHDAAGERFDSDSYQMQDWERRNPRPSAPMPAWLGDGQGDLDDPFAVAPRSEAPGAVSQPSPFAVPPVDNVTQELFQKKDETDTAHVKRVFDELFLRYPQANSDPGQKQAVMSILGRIGVHPSKLSELKEGFGGGGAMANIFGWTPESRRVGIPWTKKQIVPLQSLPFESLSWLGYGESPRATTTRRKKGKYAGGFRESGNP